MHQLPFSLENDFSTNFRYETVSGSSSTVFIPFPLPRSHYYLCSQLIHISDCYTASCITNTGASQIGDKPYR